MGYPSVYPTGSTIYYPDHCQNGYTVFTVRDVGIVLIDMNGNVVKLWKGIAGMPPKILPGGLDGFHRLIRSARNLRAESSKEHDMARPVTLFTGQWADLPMPLSVNYIPISSNRCSYPGKMFQ